MLVVELTPETATGYVRRAFDELLAVAERLGDERVNERPLGPTTNAVAALIVHCCGVVRVLARPRGTRARQPSTSARRSSRARPASVSCGTWPTRPAARWRPISGPSRPVRDSPHSGDRASLEVDDTDASLVLHVIEELFQHLGHAELAADALLQ